MHFSKTFLITGAAFVGFATIGGSASVEAQ